MKLLAACLVVGLVMVALKLEPSEVYTAVGAGLSAGWRWCKAMLTGEVGRVLGWGASIVLPIWALGMAVMFFRRQGTKSNKPPF